MLRGEVWHTEAKNGLRLVVIVSSDALGVLPLRVVVPLVNWKEEFTSAPWLVRIPPLLNSGIEEVMAADTLQVYSTSNSNFKTRLGLLPVRIVDEVSAALAQVVHSSG